MAGITITAQLHDHGNGHCPDEYLPASGGRALIAGSDFRVRSESPARTTYSMKLAIIGLGNIAARHMEVLHDLKDVEVVGAVNRTEEKGIKFCRKWGIGKFFTSVEGLNNWGGFEAALVCVSMENTVSTAKAIMDTGRPCLIEKPLGFSAEEASVLPQAAALAGTWGMVAVNRRFYSNINKAKKIIATAGGLRSILIEHTEWMHQRLTWGFKEEIFKKYLYANGIHLVDTMCYLAGIPIEIVAKQRAFEDFRNAYDALFIFDNGAVGHYSAQWYSPGRWSIDLSAKDVRIVFHNLETAVVRRTDEAEQNIDLDEIDITYKPGFYAQMRIFADAVVNNALPGKPACLLDEGVAIMKIIDELVGRY